jgi:hypothetical protein
MWTCPGCHRKFKKTNQVHSCNEKTLDDYLKPASPHSVDLFNHFIAEFRRIGKIDIHPTRSMIAISSRVRMAYVINFGKNFIDIVFPFGQAFEDNLCFTKIKQVPGTMDFNHHFRMCLREDVNAEVRKFMKMAFDKAAG